MADLKTLKGPEFGDGSIARAVLQEFNVFLLAIIDNRG
jgi:hypothetical protein